MTQGPKPQPISLPVESVDRLLELIPKCRTEPGLLRERIEFALNIFVGTDRLKNALVKSDIVKLRQALSAAQKFRSMWDNQLIVSSMIKGAARTFNSELANGLGNDEADRLREAMGQVLRIERSDSFRRNLDCIVEGLEAAVTVRSGNFGFLQNPLNALVVLLAQIYVDATGEPMSTPGPNEMRDPPYSDEFVLFLEYFDVATMPVFEGRKRPSNEKIRHRLRDALDRGEVPKKEVPKKLDYEPLGEAPQKSARGRLSRNPRT